jgi:hypothetical protein
MSVTAHQPSMYMEGCIVIKTQFTKKFVSSSVNTVFRYASFLPLYLGFHLRQKSTCSYVFVGVAVPKFLLKCRTELSTGLNAVVRMVEVMYAVN